MKSVYHEVALTEVNSTVAPRTARSESLENSLVPYDDTTEDHIAFAKTDIARYMYSANGFSSLRLQRSKKLKQISRLQHV